MPPAESQGTQTKPINSKDRNIGKCESVKCETQRNRDIPVASSSLSTLHALRFTLYGFCRFTFHDLLYNTVMNKALMTIDALLEKVLAYQPDADVDVLKRAYIFSSEAHCSQKRIEGSPYIEHPLAVASILADMKMDIGTIATGLLHDTVEDTETTVKDIRDLFGKEVAFLVEGLTKLSKMEFMTREEAQAENFRKMLLAMSEDLRIILIKFADRLHNMRTLQHLPENKQHRIALETLEIYAPIANRLGIGWMRTELEDLSFRILMSDLYNELVRKVAKRKEEQEEYLKEVTEIVTNKLKEEGIPGKVSWRIKHYYGIYQKMQAQEITFEQVHDVLGLRIITDTKANCYAILGLIHSLWSPVPGRFKDYIGVPKSNMYQSLHTTVIGPQRREGRVSDQDVGDAYDRRAWHSISLEIQGEGEDR